MNNDEDKLSDLLKRIDNIKLVSDEDFEKMDFYELAYYMQTLNQIDELGSEDDR